MANQGFRPHDRIVTTALSEMFTSRITRVFLSTFADQAGFLLTLSVLAIAVVGTPSFGQVRAGNRPSFEVASIKPSKTNSAVTAGVGHGQGGGRNITVKMLIALAYRVREFQIAGGPGWIGSDRFDVEGKAEDPRADPDQLRLMLQSLLEDRFQLKLHRQNKEAPIFALVVSKDGPKITLVPDQTSPTVNGPAQPEAGPNRGAMRIGRGSLVGNAVTLSLFAQLLSQRLDRTVVDKTHLDGRFDIQLHWTPDVGEAALDPGGNPLPPADSAGPSIFTAIQDQLGLKLESTKGPVDLVIIDHVEKPSAN